MFNYRNSIVAFAILFAMGNAFQANAQDTDQLYTLTVPSVLQVTAPSDISENYNTTTEGNHTFTTNDAWLVEQNSVSGATFTMTIAPFVHGTNVTYNRDTTASLAESTDPGTVWTVSDSTGDTSAANLTLAAVSTGPGDATFDLDITFVGASDHLIADGTYTMTVTSTLTALP